MQRFRPPALIKYAIRDGARLHGICIRTPSPFHFKRERSGYLNRYGVADVGDVVGRVEIDEHGLERQEMGTEPD